MTAGHAGAVPAARLPRRRVCQTSTSRPRPRLDRSSKLPLAPIARLRSATVTRSGECRPDVQAWTSVLGVTVAWSRSSAKKGNATGGRLGGHERRWAREDSTKDAGEPRERRAGVSCRENEPRGEGRPWMRWPRTGQAGRCAGPHVRRPASSRGGRPWMGRPAGPRRWAGRGWAGSQARPGGHARVGHARRAPAGQARSLPRTWSRPDRCGSTNPHNDRAEARGGRTPYARVRAIRSRNHSALCFNVRCCVS